MSTPRRVSGIVVMVVSVVMAFVSVAGTVVTWQLNSALTDGFDKMFGLVDAALETADSGLEVIDTRVGDARLQVDEFDQMVLDLGQQLIEQPVILNALAERLDAGVLAEVIQLARDGLRDAKAGAVDSVTSPLVQATDRIDSGLGEIQAAVGERRDRVNAQREEMNALRERIRRRLMIIAVVATLSLGWVLLSQAAMFVFGLSLYRGENYFDRWLKAEATPNQSG